MSQSPYAYPFAALENWAEHAGAKEALVFPLSGERMIFAEWRQKSAALARALLDSGLSPGDHVALLAENRTDWPVVQLAVAAMGGVLVPLNTHYRAEDLSYALRQSRSRALLLSPRFRSNEYLATLNAVRAGLPDLDLVITLDPSEGDDPWIDDLIQRASKSDRLLPQVSPDDIGSLQYTSGTTGFPKGALLTHRGMLENAWQTGRRLGFTGDDRYTSIIPLFHCAGCIMGVLTCLQFGATYVGVPAFDSEEMFRIVQDERCTALSGVPTSYLAMLNDPARAHYDLSSLRTGTCGGADCNPEVLLACAATFPMPELVQVYGQTEASTLISMAGCKDAVKVVDAGRPLDGYEVRISDPETGRAKPAGDIGQIEARGVMTMRGYFERPRETAEALSSDGWLRTGDLGFLTREGRLVIAGGRLKDMIIRGGENVYPVEIENVLLNHPAVAEVAVFGLPDEYYGEIVAAALRLNASADPASLSAFCESRIARFKTPARWFLVEKFPLTSSGKIRKVELKEWARDGRMKALS
jgi:fatty-acyl-CoA synthase